MRITLSNTAKKAVLAACLCVLLYVLLPFLLARFFPAAAELCRKYQFFSMIIPGIIIYSAVAWYSGDFVLKKSDFQDIDIANISIWSLGILPVNAVGTWLWMELLKILKMPFDFNVPVEDFIKSCSGIELVGAGIFICILTPLIEECIFRKVIYEGLREHFPAVFSITVTALFFAVLHGILFQLLSLLLLGIYFQILYCREKKLGASIYAHFLNNSFAFIMLLFFKYFPDI